MVIWEERFKREGYIWVKPAECVTALVPLLKKRKFRRILDLACGTGRHTVYLSKKGFQVTGFDLSRTGLRLAQEWLVKEGMSNYSLVEGDMTKLPFPNNDFDSVVSTNAIHHNKLSKIKETVNEIRRVLSSKGLVFVTIPSFNDYKFGIGKKIEEGTYQLEGETHHFFDEDGIKKLFSEFKILKFDEVGDKIPWSLANEAARKFVKKEKLVNVHWHVLAEKR